MKIKEILTENDSFKSPSQISSYIGQLHTGQIAPEEIDEWVYQFDWFTLDKIPLESLSLKKYGINQDKISKYIDMSGNIPPIVIDGNSNWIIDGYHRANAAKMRGDKYIMAYVGREK